MSVNDNLIIYNTSIIITLKSFSTEFALGWGLCYIYKWFTNDWKEEKKITGPSPKIAILLDNKTCTYQYSKELSVFF